MASGKNTRMKPTGTSGSQKSEQLCAFVDETYPPGLYDRTFATISTATRTWRAKKARHYLEERLEQRPHERRRDRLCDHFPEEIGTPGSDGMNVPHSDHMSHVA
jgi:hypothetical protein